MVTLELMALRCLAQPPAELWIWLAWVNEVELPIFPVLLSWKHFLVFSCLFISISFPVPNTGLVARTVIL